MPDSTIEFDLDGVGHQLQDRQLSVPHYQRSYSWDDAEINEFWDDLSGAFLGARSEYFLGTIVITKTTDRDAIIDGQQRLATTAILLAAIRDAYKAKGDQTRAGIIQQHYLSTADLGSATEVPRLRLNNEDDSFFYKHVVLGQATAPTRSSHELIAKALTRLSASVDKFVSDAGVKWVQRLAELTEFLTKRARAIFVDVPTESDAFMIFETLNDRGADLTIADLLKNYLFGRAGAQLGAVQSAWLQALGALEMSAENKTFTTFLRQFWSSKHGPTRERELYKGIKERVTTATQAVDFGDDLHRGARLYAAILSSDHEYWAGLGTETKRNIETLLRLELEQHRPLLLAAMQHFAPVELKKLLRAMVAWLVRGLIVGGIGGGTAEAKFCEAAKEIRAGTAKTAAEVLPLISEVVPTDTEFESQFATAKANRGSLARYYLLAMEKFQTKAPEPELVPNEDEAQVNLEHVLPKNPTGTDWPQFTPDEKGDYLHRIGNLPLLQKGPNDRIGNKPFTVKKPILAASKLALTAEIGAEPDWTPTAIAKRQRKLAELAVKVWPREPQ